MRPGRTGITGRVIRPPVALERPRFRRLTLAQWPSSDRIRPGYCPIHTSRGHEGRVHPVFLRGSFEVNGASRISALRLEALFDDGFKLWVNGTLVFRPPCPTGKFPWEMSPPAAPARTTISNVSRLRFSGTLREGRNVVAVQVANISLGNSSDAFLTPVWREYRGRPAADLAGSNERRGRHQCAAGCSSGCPSPESASVRRPRPHHRPSHRPRWRGFGPPPVSGRRTRPLHRTERCRIQRRLEHCGDDSGCGRRWHLFGGAALAVVHHRNLIRYRIEARTDSGTSEYPRLGRSSAQLRPVLL